MAHTHSTNTAQLRQYFEHPRCQQFQRQNGITRRRTDGSPAAISGEYTGDDNAAVSDNFDKEAPEKSLSPLLLLGLMYTYTISGAYAIEESVMGGGPLLALASIVFIPIFMAAPTAVVVTELAAAIPSNASVLIWTQVSFSRVIYFASVLQTLLLTFVDNALFPVLVSEYVCTSVECTTWQNKMLRTAMLLFTYILNIIGVKTVGWVSVAVSVATVVPVSLLFVLHLFQTGFYLNWPAISFIPDEIDWPTFIATASWNLCGLEQVATVTEETKTPHKTIMRALIPLMGLAFLTYIPPILTGASTRKGLPDISEWTTGYWAEVALTVGGIPLQVLVVVASAFSAFGLTMSALCTTTQVIAGTALTGVFPEPIGRILYQRNKRFGTYHWTLTINALITGIFGIVLDFGPLVKVDQVLYGVRIVMLYMSFVIIRYRYPHLDRPYRVPLEGYQLLIFIIPGLLFTALTVVAMMEDTQTIIVNVSVLVGSFVISGIYCTFIHKEEFHGGIVTEPLHQVTAEDDDEEEK
ncbi:putative amino acid permease/transporter [Trypanosoma theileri]|uniref:Putative amino acid permease/transporter n=1 Tax=Trypanosoma theileri TaxID=67003 RepID=A0A1X0NV66_9TRYP|nr:putative amino acid permease/transporter [Trypanosoma theileri]ORC88562.1 putative amino acid permease/transporter [Trypanosoma theileri]